MTYFSSKCGRVEIALVLLAGSLLLAAPAAARTAVDEVVGGGTDTAAVAAPEEGAPESEGTVIDTVLRMKSVGGLVHVDVEKSEADQVRMGENLVIGEDMVVKGDAVVIGGNLDVYGTVRGDAVVVGGTLRLHETAQVYGEAVAVAGRVVKDDGAVVKGQQVTVGPGFEKLLPWGWQSEHLSPGRSLWIAFRKAIVRMILSFFAILVFVDLFSRPTARVANKIKEDYFRAGLAGILSIILTPVSILVLIISLIGILLLPFLGLLIGVAFVWGWVAVSLETGRAVGGRYFPDVKSARWQALLGAALLYVTTLFGHILLGIGGPLQFIGWTFLIAGKVIVLVALMIGFGAVLMTRFGRRGNDGSAVEVAEPAPVSEG